MKSKAKIIKLRTAHLNELIQGCRENNPSAQTSLYQEYAPILFAICKRYLKSHEEAEDLLMQSFMTIFNKIGDFQFQGSFEGWMKRIAVNQCLMHLRKKKIDWSPIEDQPEFSAQQPSVLDRLYESEILDLLDQLPEGYRTIFNLYVIEGFKHREIAEELGISINTSKSQLILARKRLAKVIQNLQKDERTQGN